MIDFASALAPLPLVAILRGICRDEVEAAGDALVEADFTLIEVPLNSPDPLVSIKRLARRVGDHALVGAGTVLTPAQVAQIQDAGGKLIVSPNTDVAVIAESAARGLVSRPGYFTPSEAFAALAAGASGLNLFPAEAATPSVIKAQRAVLPKDVPLLVVGGIAPDNMGTWRTAGASGVGLGSALYTVGATTEEISTKARAFTADWAEMKARDTGAEDLIGLWQTECSNLQSGLSLQMHSWVIPSKLPSWQYCISWKRDCIGLAVSGRLCGQDD